MTAMTASGELRSTVDEADLPSLIAALAHHTGDPSLLRADLFLDPELSAMPNCGWTDAQVESATEMVMDVLAGLPEVNDAPAPATAGDALTRQIFEWITGNAGGDASATNARPLDDDTVQMLVEELGLGPDHRAPSWTAADHPDAPAHHVVIIGAGMSGILAGQRLGQAGIAYTVVDKNPDFGGTWFENTYPGCRVDVPNHVYAYSHAQRSDWPRYHSPQEVLLDYFATCARKWGVADHVRFGVHVDSMAWDADAAQWNIEATTADGPETIRATAVISAVGQLNQPVIPPIAGREDFTGPAFHSSRWPDDLDLSGKRVAVIGTGASAMQFIPHLATDAAHVTVFQRTPAWLIPREEYHDELPRGLLELFERLPGYHHWFRLHRFWQVHHGSLDALHHDPSWQGDMERSVSEGNEFMRLLLTEYLQGEFGDRPDLLEKVVPQYPVGAKRFVLDNGIWARTLKRDNVELVTTPIDAMTPTGVRSADGVDHDVDLVIYGTGFNASGFLLPMQVTGVDNTDLHQSWGDDARAYLGVAVPNFPNLFCLYGPNTNIVVNGSIIYFSECGVRYILEAMRLLHERGARSIQVRDDVHEAQVERVDQRNAEMAWGISGVSSWYKSPSGRIAQNWPFALIDYWRATHTINPDHYHLT
jgi:4-hydroxyacetophenone monooxygenase